jgi:hypothetical protein
LGIGSFFENDLIDRNRIPHEVPVEIVWKALAYSGGADAFGELLRRYERDDVRDSVVPVWLRSEAGDEWAIGRWLFTTLMPNFAMPPKVLDNLNAFYMRSLPAEKTREVDLERIRAAANEDMAGAFGGMWRCAPGAVAEV